MSTPGYQGITSDSIPQLSLKEGDVRVRIIAGNDAGLQQGEVEGPAPVSYTHLDVYKRQQADSPVCSSSGFISTRLPGPARSWLPR